MTIVTASQRRLIELMDVSDPSSPFYNIFPVLDLGPFAEADSEDFVNVDRADFPRLTGEEKRKILAFAKGHPLALQVACARVYDAKENHVRLADALSAAREEMCGYIPEWT
jgi:hypothetical protein